jgi:ATP/maltotriose-dependent transcriptional regulator MalT
LSTLALAAPAAEAAVVIEGCLAWASEPDADADAMGLVGTALCTVGAGVFAHGFLTVAAERMREDGRVRPLARGLALRATSGFLLGIWPAAEADAAEAAEFASETGQPVWAAAALTAQALLAGARGDPGANALASRAERLALPARARAALAMVQMARGLTAMSAGRHDDAYHELRRMFDATDLAYHSAKCGRAIGLLAEAAVQSGHQDEARVLLREVALGLEQSASPWQCLSVRHAQALLAEDDEGGELFQAALAADLARWPFERARLQLAYGAWLRRRRRAADSRVPLRAARDTFEALGAAPWSDRASQELRASGETSRHRSPEARDQLSPQELQVAGLAASGLSNREIGEKLYLSHRTVASHLYRIFPKLGITSRAELPAALAAGQATRAFAGD